MSQVLIQRGFEQARKLLLVQAIVIVALASLGLIKEFLVSVALLSGGAGVFFANAYFVYKAFSKSGAQANKQVMRAFYLGETVKILMAASSIIVAFLLLPGYEGYVLAGYIVALLTQWLAPVIVKTH